MKTLPKTLVLPPAISHGAGSVTDLPAACAPFGAMGMIVHGQSLAANGVLDRILDRVPRGIRAVSWQHPGGEPTLSALAGLLNECRKEQVEWVAAIGGGSVLDIAKAAAGLINGRGDAAAYHDGLPVEEQGIPFAAVPTTAGTGSEVTTVSVLTNQETGVKKSIRHPSFMARVVVLDPELLATCPPHVIAHSGMDAYTQAIESYSSVHATWLSDAFSLKGLAMLASNLEAVYATPASGAADDLLVGSTLAGLALSLARLGAVHGLAHPLGIRYHEPHGRVCAVCLPLVIEMNRTALGGKYAAMSEAVGDDLLVKTRGLLDRLGITSPFPAKEVLDEDRIIDETLSSGSTAANPKPVTRADVKALLDTLFDRDSESSG